MIETLVGYVLQFLDFFMPMTIVAEYEKAVLLRFGKYKRTLEPGLRWKIPFGVDDVLKDNVVPATRNLQPQKLTTSDGVTVVVGAALRWSIRDIVKVKLHVEDSDSVLDDSTYGEIAGFVRESTWDQINEVDWVQQVFAAVRKRAFRFGIEVEELWITDLARTRVLCLVNDTSGAML